jgi:hypothetical protein
MYLLPQDSNPGYIEYANDQQCHDRRQQPELHCGDGLSCPDKAAVPRAEVVD